MYRGIKFISIVFLVSVVGVYGAPSRVFVQQTKVLRTFPLSSSVSLSETFIGETEALDSMPAEPDRSESSKTTHIIALEMGAREVELERSELGGKSETEHSGETKLYAAMLDGGCLRYLFATNGQMFFATAQVDKTGAVTNSRKEPLPGIKDDYGYGTARFAKDEAGKLTLVITKLGPYFQFDDKGKPVSVPLWPSKSPMVDKYYAAFNDNSWCGNGLLNATMEYSSEVPLASYRELLAELIDCASKNPEDYAVIREAIQLAGDDFEADPHLAKAILAQAKNPSASLRSELVDMLARNYPDKYRALCLSFLDDQDDSVRVSTITGIADGDWKDAEAIFRKYINDHGLDPDRAESVYSARRWVMVFHHRRSSDEVSADGIGAKTDTLEAIQLSPSSSLILKEIIEPVPNNAAHLSDRPPGGLASDPASGRAKTFKLTQVVALKTGANEVDVDQPEPAKTISPEGLDVPIYAAALDGKYLHYLFRKHYETLLATAQVDGSGAVTHYRQESIQAKYEVNRASFIKDQAGKLTLTIDGGYVKFQFDDKGEPVRMPDVALLKRLPLNASNIAVMVRMKNAHGEFVLVKDESSGGATLALQTNQDPKPVWTKAWANFPDDFLERWQLIDADAEGDKVAFLVFADVGGEMSAGNGRAMFWVNAVRSDQGWKTNFAQMLYHVISDHVDNIVLNGPDRMVVIDDKGLSTTYTRDGSGAIFANGVPFNNLSPSTIITVP